jgi:hypothetical protein
MQKKEFNSVLLAISGLITSYEDNEYMNLHYLHTLLTCNMYYLAEYQVRFKNEWLKAYYQSEETSNAAKEKAADATVPELYQCRKILEFASKVAIAISQEIKGN